MNISDWWELLLTTENTLADIIQKFYPSAVNNFHKACRAKQDSEVYRIIHEVWFRVPDKQWIHSISGWGILCDLCSEYPH